MFFNSRSLLKLALATVFIFEASALRLEPWGTGHHPGKGTGQAVRRTPAFSDSIPLKGPEDLRGKPVTTRSMPAVELKAISDPGVLLRGRSEKRDMPGNGCFDPAKYSTFFWGGYAGDNVFVANFTMAAQNEDEYILAVENFAKRMKSIKCGTPGQPILLEFSDVDSLNYAKSAWKWIDTADINHFTLVTEPNMCFQGDDRSPYLVSAIKWDDAKLMAEITADEKTWEEVAKSYHLNLSHEYVDPATANATHPHLIRREDEGTKMDISHTFSGNLFNFAKDSKQTAGLALNADLALTTAGSIIVDFDVKTNFFKFPNDVQLTIHPQGVTGDMVVSLNVDGSLGKEFQFDMNPEIEIPVQALKIAKLIEIGPFITMGVHFGSSALEGTGDMSIGTKAKIKDEAKVDVKMSKPEENSISGWEPEFETIAPTFSAEITGNIRAWSELGIQIKAELFGKWGYQSAIDAQLPFYEASMSGIVDNAGVCDSMKTVGVKLGTDVGINVNLNAGKVNEAPDFQKDLFETAWPLYSTCIPVGPDNVKPTETTEPVTTEEPTETPASDDVLLETGTGGMAMITDAPVLVTGTGTASSGWPVATGNTTFLRMAQRRPTQLYL